MIAGEDATARHQTTSFADHLDAYIDSLDAAGACPEHRQERRRQLRRLADVRRWRALADLQREAVERWLALQTREGMGARTRNSYLTSALAFCNWAIDTDRLLANPFDRVPKADEKADPRRQQRAMTASELDRLLPVARERPLLDALTVRKGPRKGERSADVRPVVQERLRPLDRERALIDKALVLIGSQATRAQFP
jgi:site-specific recombinase XerC